ncbi:MAG: GDP-mannose 4,6-dehydratase [Candidatus Diapherotrites archaeon]|uniref:GDP-mannose 4,6-dehydratase n=1 Tax=Candidatus Iainarchaeum sp. TaxID=3101447 RepID=A0A938YQL0_9ARCH|nr:GDP-mannose 4,6-dehydratase [Candidatus Diapherotrites archaeon]
MSDYKKSFWFDKNVLITGATGIIGSQLTMQLMGKCNNLAILKRDHEHNSLLETSKATEKIDVIRGELEDLQTMMRALAEYEIDTVFHLGAQPIVQISKVIPVKTFESNIMGTWNLLEACRIISYESDKIKRIVLASSDKAYGPLKTLPYNEEMPLCGELPYDVSKSCCDLIAQTYFKTYNLPVAISRFGNVFGPGDLNFNRIVPGTIRSILLDEDIIIRSDGTLLREYFYVKDAADAYIVLAENLESKKLHGQAFNFSSGIKLSVLQIVDKIIDLMGSKKKPTILGEAKLETKEQYLSTEKAEKILGWKAKTEFDPAMKETIEWYRKFFKK